MRHTQYYLYCLLLGLVLFVGCGGGAEPYDADAAAAAPTELSPEDAASEPSGNSE